MILELISYTLTSYIFILFIYTVNGRKSIQSDDVKLVVYAPVTAPLILVAHFIILIDKWVSGDGNSRDV